MHSSLNLSSHFLIALLVHGHNSGLVLLGQLSIAKLLELPCNCLVLREVSDDHSQLVEGSLITLLLVADLSQDHHKFFESAHLKISRLILENETWSLEHRVGQEFICGFSFLHVVSQWEVLYPELDQEVSVSTGCLELKDLS